MRMNGVQTTDSGDLAALRDAARNARAAAMSRRRALAAGQSAPAQTPVAINGVAAAGLGRVLSMQRRRQMSQGKQAPTEAGAEARAFIVYRGGAS